MKSISPPISVTFSRCPVDRSSIMRTRAPWSLSAAAIWEPIKPAPPVTKATPESGISLLSSYPDIFKAHLAHVCRLVDITQVGNPGDLHHSPNALHIQGAKLVPFGHEDQHLSSGRGLILVSRVFDFR